MGKNKKKKNESKITEPIDLSTLPEQVVPVEMQDSMAVAGQKILLRNFVQMLNREPGARTGEHIEDVHQMRVATRRMRSAFKVFADYYKPKAIRPFNQFLKTLAAALGVVRDLDVMVGDLTKYQSTLPEPEQAVYQTTLERLNALKSKGRAKLVVLLDSPDYAQFTNDFARFLTQPGNEGDFVAGNAVTPYQVRHVAPVVIYQYLARVRAYDAVLENAELATLHALRIEFKRLRYTITHFNDVLGTSSQHFITDLKEMQDYLGRLNDIRVARPYLKSLAKEKKAEPLDDAAKSALKMYLSELKEEEVQQYAAFPKVWAKFNTRTVQRKLSDSLLVLR